MVHSKNKGSAFERLVCKQLSLWVSGGRKEDLFWRAALSGGRATLAMRQGKAAHRVSGDIAAVQPEGHVLTDAYHIECKHLHDVGFGQFFVRGTGPLAKIWADCRKHAAHHAKLPMLIVRQNLFPTVVIKYEYAGRPPGIRVYGRDPPFDVWLFDNMVKFPYQQPRAILKVKP
jgi:hypothetical protein